MGDNGQSFFFNKVEPLFTHVRAVSKSIWDPGCRLSVDEMMVLCMGRCFETVRVKGKPIGQGFTIWSLCERGYVYDFFSHSNKFKWKYLEPYKGKLMHSSAVVAGLVECLPRQRGANTLMYQIYMDNWFSSVALFKMLRDQKIGCAGTKKKSNTTGFPTALKVRGALSAKMNWDTLGTVVLDNVNCICWIDNGVVLMLSTIHKVGQEHSIIRFRKRPRETSTNAKKVREVFGTNVTKELPIPIVISDYNHYMGGADIADQLRANYGLHVKGVRTWLPSLYWLLDTSVSNSFIALREYDPGQWGKKTSHKTFRREVAWELMKFGIGQSTNYSTVVPSVGMKRRRNSAMMASSNLRLGFGLKHLPICISTANERKRCVLCSCALSEKKMPSKAAPKSQYYCLACEQGTFLCIAPERNCFERYHTVEDLSKHVL